MEGNYTDLVKSLLRKHIDVEEELLDLYALLVLTVGEECTLKNIHDAWSLFTARKNAYHPSLVPFESLTERIKRKDLPYQEAVIAVAEEIF